MHVGLNLVFLTPGEQGGMEIYARELIPKLITAAPQHRFTAFVNLDAAGSGGPWNDLTATVTVPVRAANRIEWVRGEQQLLPRLARRAGVDLLHSLASTAPAWGDFHRVLTVHDLIYRTLPQAHPGLRSIGMRVLVPLAVRTSDRVIAISETTRRDLLRYTSITADRVDVVPSGGGSAPCGTPVPEAALRTELSAGERPIVLSVSAKLAHKNLPRLLGALARIDPPQRPLLVLPGYPTPHEDELRARAAELGVTDDVRFLGWVSGATLEGLYAAARCVVLPSLAEGFGLPALEAMARGKPLACAAGGALAETAGDAALLFEPTSEPAIAMAIVHLLGDDALAADLAARGRRRAAHFSWAETARGTFAAYERATGTRPPVDPASPAPGS